MNTKNLVLMALLVAVGAALYIVVPGINGGMKADFMLTMMFIGIILFPTFKETFLLAVTSGVLSGLFSTFPGGFLPNIIDKFVTGFVFLLVVLALRKFIKNIIVNYCIVGLGTVLSGTLFLSMALLLTDVPIDFKYLFLTVVIPTTALNVIVYAVVFPIVTKLLKRSNFKTSLQSA